MLPQISGLRLVSLKGYVLSGWALVGHCRSYDPTNRRANWLSFTYGLVQNIPLIGRDSLYPAAEAQERVWPRGLPSLKWLWLWRSALEVDRSAPNGGVNSALYAATAWGSWSLGILGLVGEMGPSVGQGSATGAAH